MKRPDHLSHTALLLWQRDPAEFYLRYMADASPPRPPQTLAASIGSAFDALVKHKLGGPDYAETFTESVPGEHAAAAHEAAHHIWHTYAGRPSDQWRVILHRASDIRFESRTTGLINGVPFVGYPDMSFRHYLPVIVDWKVRGYTSRRGVSPTKGYAWCYDPTGDDFPTVHKAYLPTRAGAWVINSVNWEDVQPTYAAQLTVYSELLDAPDAVLCVDEIVARPRGLRVAHYRGRVGAAFRQELRDKAARCWEWSQSTEPDEHLERVAASVATDAHLNETSRPVRYY